MKKGIDISYFQGDVDFKAVANSGIEFVIIRDGYLYTTDSKFFEYVKQARESGLVILGVYHFSYALNKEEARREASFCVENMKKAGLGPETIVFYDFEYDTVMKASKNGVTLGSAECNLHTTEFCEEVKRLGFVPGVYTNIDYHKNWYNQDVLSKYHVWLADYKGEPDFNCLVQQYSSTGKVSGIKGNVDLDYYYGEDFKMNPIITESNVTVTNKTIKAAYPAKSMNKSIAGTYITTSDLYCRNNAGVNSDPLCVIPKGTKVQNYGYYTEHNGVKWLYIQFTLNGTLYEGFSSSLYLK